MQGRVKYIFIAFAMLLTTIFSIVGVFAFTSLDFAVGGNITYTAPKEKYTATIQVTNNSYSNTSGLSYSINGADFVRIQIGYLVLENIETIQFSGALMQIDLSTTPSQFVWNLPEYSNGLSQTFTLTQNITFNIVLSSSGSGGS